MLLGIHAITWIFLPVVKYFKDHTLPAISRCTLKVMKFNYHFIFCPWNNVTCPPGLTDVVWEVCRRKCTNSYLHKVFQKHTDKNHCFFLYHREQQYDIGHVNMNRTYNLTTMYCREHILIAWLKLRIPLLFLSQKIVLLSYEWPPYKSKFYNVG